MENILDEDDDVESEKEQDAMDGAESSAKNPTNKIPEPSLGEVIALLREAIKLCTTQNTGLGNKSKVDSILSLTADPTSYSINSVNLVADPASHSTNSVKLVADPAKSCCSSNTVSNTCSLSQRCRPNEHVTHSHFKMDALNTALDMVRKNCYMASTDLTDACYSFPVATVDQQYLMFQFEGIRY